MCARARNNATKIKREQFPSEVSSVVPQYSITYGAQANTSICMTTSARQVCTSRMTLDNNLFDPLSSMASHQTVHRLSLAIDTVIDFVVQCSWESLCMTFSQGKSCRVHVHVTSVARVWRMDMCEKVALHSQVYDRRLYGIDSCSCYSRRSHHFKSNRIWQMRVSYLYGVASVSTTTEQSSPSKTHRIACTIVLPSYCMQWNRQT